jgi:hypothetical protein
MTWISEYAKRKNIIIVATNPHRYNQQSNYLQTIAQQNSNVSLSFNKEKGARVVSLHKHPSLPLGTIKLLSENTTLTQFIQKEKPTEPQRRPAPEDLKSSSSLFFGLVYEKKTV